MFPGEKQPISNPKPESDYMVISLLLLHVVFEFKDQI